MLPAWCCHIIERGWRSAPFTQSTARGQTISSPRHHLLPLYDVVVHSGHDSPHSGFLRPFSTWRRLIVLLAPSPVSNEARRWRSLLSLRRSLDWCNLLAIVALVLPYQDSASPVAWSHRAFQGFYVDLRSELYMPVYTHRAVISGHRRLWVSGILLIATYSDGLVDSAL